MFKKIQFLCVAGLIGLMFLSACTGTEESTDHDHTTGVDSLPPEPLPVMGFDCAELGEGNFCSLGFDFIQIGDTLMWRELQIPEGATLKDSVLVADVEGDTIAANIRTITFDDGKVVLESDWQGAMFLNRIQVTTSHYETTEGLKVGSTVADLRAVYPELQARAFPEYGIAEIFPIGSDGNPYMVFHVDDPNQQYVSPTDSTWSSAGIPDEAEIVGIVVM